MRLLLARHGETDWNAGGRIQGATDIALNAAGREQAAALARRLREAGERIDTCYTSPLVRARETAEIVCRELGLTPIPMEALRECCFGLWEGHTWEEVEALWPERHRASRSDRRANRPPEGESYGDVLDRVLPALEKIAAQGEGTALLVCHGAVINAVLSHRANVPFDDRILKKGYALGNAQWVEI